MSRSLQIASCFLFSTALVAPSLAYAQSGGGTPTGSGSVPSTGNAAPTATPQTDAQTSTPPADGTTPTGTPPTGDTQVDVSIPGGSDIVVTGRREGNITRSQPQVVSVLSSADIARTGEGDIAGALSRVTGLSVVGNGFVYVRGLGDRYSLALLNGSPLPSPEPLRRVVPLDIFPTNIISSSLVQKSYSVNFPGEFGGGVINLTTKAAPKKPFLSIGGSGGYDTETTGKLGYTYYGTQSDWTGFGDGSRKLSQPLRAFLSSGNRISQLSVADNSAIAASLVNGRNSVVQRNGNMPPNAAALISAGGSFDAVGATFGVIATAGYSSKWRTRDVLQQTSLTLDLSAVDTNFRRVITDNRVVVNGLLGLNAEFGENQLRLTTLYIRDTLKQARLGIGTRNQNGDQTLLQQNTAWFARQLFESQIVGEFKFTPELSLDVRGGYAQTRRDAPDEFSYEYVRSNSAADPYGNIFVNTLNNGSRGNAEVAYSFLKERLLSAGVDLSYKVTPEFTASIGYNFNDTNRRTERRDFTFLASGLPLGLSVLRPDILLSYPVIVAGITPGNTNNPYSITLIDQNESRPAFRAKLRNHAGYARVQWQAAPNLTLDTGVRFEQGNQTVNSIAVFNVPIASTASTRLRRDYWLPAATLTWELADRQQLRFNASKTIARPQFRELIFQPYFDPESNRQFEGNPLLVDSQLYNFEARYEWYFAPQQRFSISGFFKKINRPIETFVSDNGNGLTTGFANAPTANLWGGEVEIIKYFNLDSLGENGFFSTRQLTVSANYTYTKSKIKVRAGDLAPTFSSSLGANAPASNYFRDGAPLTGQSDHIANLEIGLEDKNRLSQQTLLLSYASERVTARGPTLQPDIKERPGLRLDFVWREAVKLAGVNTELKLDIRNITGTNYQEFQQSGKNRIYYNKYDVGTIISFGAGINF